MPERRDCVSRLRLNIRIGWSGDEYSVTEQTANKTRHALDAFLSTSNVEASSTFLADLMDGTVEPLVMTLIRGKLNVSLQPGDERQINQDAIDIVSEVKTLVITKLTKLKSGNGLAGIDNLESYVKTVATNATHQYLRKKYPFRLRLKNQLRYLLTHDRRFSLWTTDAGDRPCGLVAWPDNEADVVETGRFGQLTDDLRQEFASGGVFPDRIPLVDLVNAIFCHFRRPMLFDDLVSVIYELKRITEPREVLEEEAASLTSAGHESGPLDRLEQTAFLIQLWEEIGSLPLRHRSALLLNLKDAYGDGLIALFPMMRIVTIRQIAEKLEFPVKRFAQIWSELPWDDLTIAQHLGITRQQVINLRQSARAMLRRRLNYF
jgi:hypothetical protein